MTRLLSDDDVNRIIDHYKIMQNNHKFIARGFKPITNKEILVFVLKYIKPPLQHFKVIEDDCITIEKKLIDLKISYPIL